MADAQDLAWLFMDGDAPSSALLVSVNIILKDLDFWMANFPSFVRPIYIKKLTTMKMRD